MQMGMKKIRTSSKFGGCSTKNKATIKIKEKSKEKTLNTLMTKDNQISDCGKDQTKSLVITDIF